MKKRLFFLTMLLCAFLMLGSASVMAADNDAGFDVRLAAVEPSDVGVYRDVAPREWYYNYITFTSKHSIFNGYPEGDFRPNHNMSRAEVVRVLYAIEGMPEVTPTKRFSDVELGVWYAEEVEWAAANEIISGYPDGTFMPDKNVSRQDFVAMLYRYANYKNYNTTELAELNFPDADETADYAQAPMAWAVDSGIINGKQEADGIYLRPTTGTTRAEVAKMLGIFAIEYKQIGATSSAFILTEENTITVGCSRLLQYGALPDATAYTELTWVSSDPDVVTVSRGIITGVSAGEATITATTFDGNVATCRVTVTEESADPYQDLSDYIMLHGEGVWNDTLYCLYYSNEDGWEIYYGAGFDYANSSVMFIFDVNDAEEEYFYEMTFLTQKNSTEWICMIEAFDDYEGLSWRGETTVDVSTVNADTELTLTSFTCDEPAYAIDEVKTALEELLSVGLQTVVLNMDDMFTDMGLDITNADFGFVGY